MDHFSSVAHFAIAVPPKQKDLSHISPSSSAWSKSGCSKRARVRWLSDNHHQWRSHWNNSHRGTWVCLRLCGDLWGGGQGQNHWDHTLGRGKEEKPGEWINNISVPKLQILPHQHFERLLYFSVYSLSLYHTRTHNQESLPVEIKAMRQKSSDIEDLHQLIEQKNQDIEELDHKLTETIEEVKTLQKKVEILSLQKPKKHRTTQTPQRVRKVKETQTASSLASITNGSPQVTRNSNSPEVQPQQEQMYAEIQNEEQEETDGPSPSRRRKTKKACCCIM